MSLLELKNAVDAYGRLFSHRTKVLEGIRKVACRNMSHFDRARIRCEENHEDLPEAGKESKIYEYILWDQGAVPSKELVHYAKGAAFLPAQVYLALLYAEIEFYQKTCRQLPLLNDEFLSDYLDNKSLWVDTLKQFRHVFLHAKSGFGATGLNFHNARYFFHEGPLLQIQINAYLAKIQSKLRKELLTACECLPREARDVCLHRYAVLSKLRTETYEGARGVSSTSVDLHEASRSWEPSAQQHYAINLLSDCLDIVTPSGPENRAAQDASVAPDHAGIAQIPISPGAISEVRRGKGRPSYGETRLGKHATRYREQYRLMVLVSHLLINESAVRADMAGTRPDIPRGTDPQAAAEFLAPLEVGMALLFEPLRIYAKLIEESPQLRVENLDEWAAGRLYVLREYRNAVFHVACGEDRYLELPFGAPRGGPGVIGKLHGGLADFFPD